MAKDQDTTTAESTELSSEQQYDATLSALTSALQRAGLLPFEAEIIANGIFVRAGVSKDDFDIERVKEAIGQVRVKLPSHYDPKIRESVNKCLSDFASGLVDTIQQTANTDSEQLENILRVLSIGLLNRGVPYIHVEQAMSHLRLISRPLMFRYARCNDVPVDFGALQGAINNLRFTNLPLGVDNLVTEYVQRFHIQHLERVEESENSALMDLMSKIRSALSENGITGMPALLMLSQVHVLLFSLGKTLT